MLIYISRFIAILFIFFFIGITANSQEDPEIIDNTVFENPQRPPVIFHHEEHNENAGLDECNQCHHLYEDGKYIEDEDSSDQSCSDCHELFDTESPSLMKAFHLNCKGCHQEQKQGPVACGECHIIQGSFQ